MVDSPPDKGEGKGKQISFAANVNGSAAHTERGQVAEMFTQDDLEEEQPEGTAPCFSQAGPSLTQCVTNEALYNDVNTRDSISLPYILVVKKGNGEDRTLAIYFFEEDDGATTIRLGAAYKQNSCDVALKAANVEGHAMNMFGLSNEAMVITYNRGTKALWFESINSRPLAFYQHHTGRSWQVTMGEMFNLGDGDEFRFADSNCDRGSPAYSVIRFVHPSWKPDLSPETKKARDEAAALIAARVEEVQRRIEVRLEKTRRKQERDEATIIELKGKQEVIMKCNSVQAVEEVMSTSLTGSKRTSEDEPSDTISNYSSDRKKDKDRRDLQKLESLQNEVSKATKFLMTEPAHKNSKWQKKARQHRETIQVASQTTCLFHVRGTCKNGDACPFWHGNWHSGSTNSCKRARRTAPVTRGAKEGVLYKWSPPIPGRPPAGRGGYGFVKLNHNGESVYVPGSILLRVAGTANIRQGMDIVVLRMKKDDRGGQNRSRVATEVQVP